MVDSGIFLIDICGTLFRSNTTFDFIRFYYSETRWYKALSCVRRIKLIAFINSLIFEIFHVDLIRLFAIHHLKGLEKEELVCMSEEFFDNFLKYKINKDVIDVIDKQRDKGIRLVIVSATLDCISEVVARKFNMDLHFSSQLSYNDNNVCQGGLQKDLLGCKLKALKGNGLKPPYYGVITDNYSDIDIIRHSNQAFLIQYLGKKDRWVALEKTMGSCKQEKIIIDRI